MQAVLWRDYLCPWCHLGRDRTALLTALGVTVTARAYDLHPDVPAEGRAVRPGGRLATVLDHIAAECAAVGLPFRVPTRIANTRLALETAELVREVAPDAFEAVDAAFYDAQWVHDRNLGDPAVVDGILAAAGIDPDSRRDVREPGAGAAAVERAMAEAWAHDVTGTPAWWIDDRLLVPGVQDRATLERWVGRLAERPDGPPRGGPSHR
jgi:predicted DsbA family dithiol-disulfide isomerase